MNKRLYYEQPTLRTFTSRISGRQNTEHGPAVRLEQTAFYPTSGGQPHDTGTLSGISVLDVWENEQGEVWHLLAQPLDTEEVTGNIDWPRRFDHMQQHTGQHLLSAAFVEILEAATIGFHLGSESSTIDLDIPHLSWEAAARVEKRVNHIVWKNQAVVTQFVKPDDLEDFNLRKPPSVSEDIRIVSVEGFDASACGGTHVAHTGEIGLIKITGIERYKGGVRVTFLCGERARQDYHQALRILQRASSALTVGQDEVVEAIERLQEENKTLRRTLNKTLAELRTLEADNIWANTPEQDGMRRIVTYWAERSFDDARAIASQLRERPRTLLLLAVTEEKGVRLVCARSDDLPEINASKILRAAAGALGGRGGGSPAMAQGGAPQATPETISTALKQAVV